MFIEFNEEIINTRAIRKIYRSYDHHSVRKICTISMVMRDEASIYCKEEFETKENADKRWEELKDMLIAYA